MENLILWEMNPDFQPRDAAERIKAQMQMLEAVKADFEKGVHTAWGMSTSGNNGYAITKLQGEQLFMTLAKFMPAVNFKTTPMLSVDECISCMTQIQKQM